MKNRQSNDLTISDNSHHIKELSLPLEKTEPTYTTEFYTNLGFH